VYLGRCRDRFWLRELGVLAGGIGYTAVAQAVSRVGRSVAQDRMWKQRLDQVTAKLSTMKL